MYYIWMAAAVAGMTALGFGVGYDLAYVLRVHLPISINGKEIRVGETTVQTLLDEGLEVSWVDEDYNRITVDPAAQLEANAYYTGGSIKVSDNMSFMISFTTDEEEVSLGQAPGSKSRSSLSSHSRSASLMAAHPLHNKPAGKAPRRFCVSPPDAGK